MRALAHETTHMFGIKHCIYYRCLMNGSNHMEETDASPLHLCPVCLRKVQWSTGLDDRYRTLLRVYRDSGFDDEVQWLTRRLAYTQGQER